MKGYNEMIQCKYLFFELIKSLYLFIFLIFFIYSIWTKKFFWTKIYFHFDIFCHSLAFYSKKSLIFSNYHLQKAISFSILFFFKYLFINVYIKYIFFYLGTFGANFLKKVLISQIIKTFYHLLFWHL